MVHLEIVSLDTDLYGFVRIAEMVDLIFIESSGLELHVVVLVNGQLNSTESYNSVNSCSTELNSTLTQFNSLSLSDTDLRTVFIIESYVNMLYVRIIHIYCDTKTVLKVVVVILLRIMSAVFTLMLLDSNW